MIECAVADYCQGRLKASLGCSLCCTDGSAHADYSLDCFVWRQSTQRVAADVRCHQMLWIILYSQIDSLVGVHMRAALAELWWPSWKAFHLACCNSLKAKGWSYYIRIKLSCHRDLAVQLAFDSNALRQNTPKFCLDERISFLNNKDFFYALCQLLDLICRCRIEAYVQVGRLYSHFCHILVEVVLSKACGDYSHLLIIRVDGQLVEVCCLGIRSKLLVGLKQVYPQFLGNCRKQHPAPYIIGFLGRVLRPYLVPWSYYSPRVCQSGDHSYKYRNFPFLGKVESLTGHLVGFLLVGRLKAWNLCKVGKEAGILLALGGVHTRVVCHHNDQTAVDFE